jgi:hypothetical protein
VRTEQACECIDGVFELIPGLRYCLWDIFGFIDCTIDQISVPFLGPHSDYKGAAWKPEYPDSQKSFYSGYAQNHFFKILTVLTKDGLSHLYGPILARHNDVGMLNISGLNEYLCCLQHDCFVTVAGVEVIYSAFGDGMFNMGLWCIVSYFHAFGRFDLTLEQLLCNRHVNSV